MSMNEYSALSEEIQNVLQMNNIDDYDYYNVEQIIETLGYSEGDEVDEYDVLMEYKNIVNGNRSEDGLM